MFPNMEDQDLCPVCSPRKMNRVNRWEITVIRLQFLVKVLRKIIPIHSFFKQIPPNFW